MSVKNPSMVSVQLLPKLNRETPEQARFVMLGIKRAQEQLSSFQAGKQRVDL